MKTKMSKAEKLNENLRYIVENDRFRTTTIRGNKVSPKIVCLRWGERYKSSFTKELKLLSAFCDNNPELVKYEDMLIQEKVDKYRYEFCLKGQEIADSQGNVEVVELFDRELRFLETKPRAALLTKLFLETYFGSKHKPKNLKEYNSNKAKTKTKARNENVFANIEKLATVPVVKNTVKVSGDDVINAFKKQKELHEALSVLTDEQREFIRNYNGE